MCDSFVPGSCRALFQYYESSNPGCTWTQAHPRWHTHTSNADQRCVWLSASASLCSFTFGLFYLPSVFNLPFSLGKHPVSVSTPNAVLSFLSFWREYSLQNQRGPHLPQCCIYFNFFIRLKEQHHLPLINKWTVSSSSAPPGHREVFCHYIPPVNTLIIHTSSSA